MTTTTTKNQNQVALTRRQFVVSSALASGGLALGFHFPAAAQSNELSTLGGSEINAWVVVRPDDSCVIRIARVAQYVHRRQPRDS